MTNKFVSTRYFEFVVLLLISALVYLPNIHQLGYYKDDWYLMYSAHTQGPEIFRDIFMSDRPARGELMLVLYRIFGDDPLYYNLSAYAFRLLSAIGFLWTVRMVWHSKRAETLLMAILFMLYPGYLSQVNAIDFQSHIVSLCFAVFSIGLSLKAIFLGNPLLRYGTALLSILLGWAYLGLVEYSIGLEVFRVCGFFIVLSRNSTEGLFRKVKKTVKEFLPFIIVPAGFLFWRIFIFQNERRATDVEFQFGELIASPVLTSLRWGIYILQDMLNVILLAWGVPLYQIGFQLRLRDAVIGITITAIILVIVRISHSKRSSESEASDGIEWRMEALWIGLVTVLASVLPVIAANRHVEFSEFSRYALPGSVGGVLVLASILYHLNPPQMRMGIAYVLIATAALTHHANVIQAIHQSNSVREFWWQVSWRVPQIKEGATLVAHYAGSGIPEDYVVWGPAHIIYYPEEHTERPVRLILSAVILSNDHIARVMTRSSGEEIFGRGRVSYQDYKNTLVISQPGSTSCVQVIDGRRVERSLYEDYGIMLVASSSNIDNVLTDQDFHVPPEVMFGPEPEHDWCYYFQKADLARQSRDWEEVARLGDEAQKAGLHPNDQIEWMPFLQAYAILGDGREIKNLSKRINTENYYKRQTCQIMTSMDEMGYPLSPETDTQVRGLFCSAEQ